MVKAFSKTTVNYLKVEKKIEAMETSDIQTFMNALMDALKTRDVRPVIETDEIPVSQQSWIDEEEQKDTPNYVRSEMASKTGGSLMQKFKNRIKEKYTRKREIEEQRKILEKSHVYYSTRKVRKMDEDDELPLFD